MTRTKKVRKHFDVPMNDMVANWRLKKGDEGKEKQEKTAILSGAKSPS